jgi:hypothetical protein
LDKPYTFLSGKKRVGYQFHIFKGSFSGSITRPKSEKMEEQLGHMKTSGFLFQTFPPVPHKGHFPVKIIFTFQIFVAMRLYRFSVFMCTHSSTIQSLLLIL